MTPQHAHRVAPPPPPTPTLAAVVAANVVRLRTERGWSQSNLAAELRSYETLNWSPALVALVETGKRRADHLLELAGFCQVFAVPLGELLVTPATRVDAGKHLVDLSSITLALAGVPTGRNHQVEHPVNVAEALGIAPDDVPLVLFDLTGEWSFGYVRDQRVPTDIHWHNAQRMGAARSVASRRLVQEMREHLLAAGGMDVIRARVAVARVERRRMLWEQDRESFARQLSATLGHWPSREELDDTFGTYDPEEEQ